MCNLKMNGCSVSSVAPAKIKPNNAPNSIASDRSNVNEVMVFQGKKDTHIHDGKPYDTIRISELMSMVADPPLVSESDDALSFMASSYNEYDGRKFEVQRERGAFPMMRCDIDKGQTPKQALVDALVAFFDADAQIAVYSTKSGTVVDPCWRGVVPLAVPMAYPEWRRYQKALHHHLRGLGIEPDETAERSGQYQRAPHICSEDAYYDFALVGHRPFDADAPEGMFPDAFQHALKAIDELEAKVKQAAEEACKRAQEHRNSGSGQLGGKSLIEAVNAANSLPDVFASYGFDTKNGDDWHHPQQSSDSYSWRDMGDAWVCLSAMAKDCDIGAVSHNGFGFGDAFDLICYFDHRNDFTAAIKALAKEIKVVDTNGELLTWDELSRRGWVEQQNRTQAEEARRQAQQQQNAKLQEDEPPILPSVLTLEQMLSQLVLIADGSGVSLVDSPRTYISYADCRNLFAPSVTVEQTTDKLKRSKTLELWRSHPKRRTVEKRTFAPGRELFCSDPEGASAINTWRRIERREIDLQKAERFTNLFVEQVNYLIPDQQEASAFLDWLAHIEQHPGMLPHYGWLHISEQTGTGRNWMASVLARLWRGMVAPNVDLPALLDSQFNGPLAGRVLAMVDEIQEGGSDTYRHAQKVKSLVNAETRVINPKYGRQIIEYNCCRWLVFSNHKNALPIDDDDRRWRVAMIDQPPRGAEVYETLYGALNEPDFIEAVGGFLAKRDIRHFKPGERPPLNDAKLNVIGASKSMLRELAEDIVERWPGALISSHQAAMYLSSGNEESMSLAMRRSMEDAGARQLASSNGKSKLLRINNKSRKCWILRDFAAWTNATSEQQVAEVIKGEFSTMDSADAGGSWS